MLAACLASAAGIAAEAGTRARQARCIAAREAKRRHLYPAVLLALECSTKLAMVAAPILKLAIEQIFSVNHCGCCWSYLALLR